MKSLRKRLGITWRDRAPYTEVLRETGCMSLQNILHSNRLRWVGHVIRMDNDRLPKQLLYGELSTGSRTAVGQLKRYKDCTKKDLKACNIPPENHETLGTVRDEWRVQTKQGLAYFEEARTRYLQEARERRHRAPTTGHSSATTTSYDCLDCGRRCASCIGLLSHMGAHRRREAERTVIVGHNGLPLAYMGLSTFNVHKYCT